MKQKFTKVEKYGFKKGIEIFNENETHGYFAVADDEKAIARMQRYVDSGMKGDEKLTHTQVLFFKGVIAGIRFGLKRKAVYPERERTSSFQQRYEEHCYGKETHYDGFAWYEVF